MVSDGEEHSVVMSWTNSSVSLLLDNGECLRNVRDCHLQNPRPPGKSQYFNSNGPLQVMVHLVYLLIYLSIHPSFISNLSTHLSNYHKGMFQGLPATKLKLASYFSGALINFLYKMYLISFKSYAISLVSYY